MCDDMNPFPHPQDLETSQTRRSIRDGEVLTVVLASRTDTFLTVERTLEFCQLGTRIDCAQEDCFVLQLLLRTFRDNTRPRCAHLVHTSIREKQRRVLMRDGGGGRDECVVL